jgi:hypothetical protein
MTSLLTLLRDGTTTDDALQQIYGYNIEGLENEWRQAVGANPSSASAQPTTQASPTFVPTIVPVSGGSFILQTTPTPIPTSTSGQPTGTPTRAGPPLTLTLILLGMCCMFLILVGIVVLGFVVRGQNMKEGKNAK